MADATARLWRMLRMSRAWQGLVRRSGSEIEDALRFVELHEEIGAMSLGEAATWRCRIMACWAEEHRKQRGEPSPAADGTGRLLRFAKR